MVNQGNLFNLYLFGHPRLEVDGQPYEIANRKAVALLIYLALNPDPHSRDSLATLLWPEYNQTRARANLRRTLWFLNQTPLVELIAAEQENIQMKGGDALGVDVIQFQERSTHLRDQHGNQLSPDRITSLSEAAKLYQGDFLQDFFIADSNAYEDWAVVRREEYRRDVLKVLDALIDYHLDHGENDVALEAAWKGLEIDNLRESTYRGLMMALTRSGQRVAALAQYENLRQLLDAELAVEPSAETTALYEQIRADSLLPAKTPSFDKQPEPRIEVVGSAKMPVFMLTDIENSTPMWDRYRQAMLEALLQHNAILNEKIEYYGGRIKELRGDGVKAMFEGGQPLEAALAIQKSFGQVDWGDIGELRIRIGLHGVPVDWEGYDFFRTDVEVTGPALNYAARVMDAGWGGQILVSKSVVEAYPLPDGATWEDFGEHELKGCEEPLNIFGLVHPDLPQQSFPQIRTLTTEATTEEDNGSQAANPYRGLYAFREQDAPFFFGREAFTDLLLETLHKRPMVAVVGPSGSGKSSVVHAGLLAQLRAQDNWLITKFRPGSQPFNALAAALIPYLEPNLSKTDQLVETNKLSKALMGREIALMDVVQTILEDKPPGTRLPLVSDQFEELYTLVPEAELRSMFMDTLTEAVFDQQYRPAPIFSLILTSRADFLGQALAHRPSADAIQESDVKLGPMTTNEMSRAIVNPAKKLKVNFETGLASRILEEVGDEPGNLPLLEFAMTQLWERQDGALLTHQSYEAINRVNGALARHADAIFDELEPEEQATARRVFIQVVRPGEGTEDTRRLATRSELGKGNWGLIQRLADARLLVTGSDAEGRETVEVVHEALIRGWGLLQKWMNADRAFRVWQERLRAVIRGWEASERDEGGLMRGLPLATAEGWLTERAEDMSDLEREFIQTSLDERERREETEREQLERERGLERSALRRLRVIVTVLVAASIVGIVLTLAVFNQNRVAQRRADEVQSLSLVSAAEEAFENNDPEQALALVMEANKVDNPPPEVLSAMRRIAYAPGVSRVIQAHASPIVDLHFSPDKRFLVSASGRRSFNEPVAEDNSLALWDFDTGEEIQRFVGHTDRSVHVDFSPDGQFLLSAAVDGYFILWDLESGDEVRRYQGQLSFPEDVRYLNYRLEDSSGPAAMFWTVRPNQELDNPFDLFLRADMVIEVVDLNTGEVIRQFSSPTPELFIKTSAASKDRDLLVAALNSRVDTDRNAPYSGSDTLIAYDVITGDELQRLEVDLPGFWTNSIEISPDGKIAAITLESSNEGVLLIWDLNSGEVLRRDFEYGVFANTFNPGGDGLYIQGADQGIEQIDPRSGDTVQTLPEDPDQLVFSEDGQRILSIFPTVLWDTASGEPLARFNLSDEATLGRLVPDGRIAITGHESGLLRFWDIKSGLGQQSATETSILSGHGDGVTEAIFSPDGRYALTAGGDIQAGTVVPGDNSIILWDLETGEISRRFEGHEATVWSLAFSPDGKLAASGSQDQRVILWDLESGEQLQRWEDLGENVMGLDFTPDGEKLLVGIGSPYGNLAVDGGLLLLDVQTGAILRRFEAQDEDKFPHVWSVAISPDGRTALSGFNPEGITLWNLETGEEIRSFMDPSGENLGAVEGLAFTPDGRYFTSGLFDGSVRLWDVKSGEQIRSYPTRDDSPPHRVAISPDGNFLIAAFGLPAIIGEGTNAVIMWDLQTGAEIQRFEGHSDWVRGIDFSPDGTQIISSSGDGTVRLWNVVGGDLFEWIESNRYVRELTPEEREQFRLSP